MCVCMYVVYIYVRTYVCMYVCLYACMYVYMYVRMYVSKITVANRSRKSSNELTMSFNKAAPELLQPDCENSAKLPTDVRPRYKIELSSNILH